MPKQVFIVYQMGKVASSSIVAALSTIPGAKVHHCHFLAPASLRRAAERALDPALSRFQYHHLSRQLMANLDCHRLVSRAQRGFVKDTAITLISVSREPLEWTRSFLVQDMPEFEPLLLRVAALNGFAAVEPGEGIAFALRRLVGCVAGLCAATGRITDIADLSQDDLQSRCGIATREEARILKRLAMLFVRPHFWFRDELEALIDAPLGSFERLAPHFHRKTLGPVTAFVLRYEDLEETFPKLAACLGLREMPALGRDNASDDKRHAAAVVAAFRPSREVDIIRRHSATDYARFFGYAPILDTATAAATNSAGHVAKAMPDGRNP